MIILDCETTGLYPSPPAPAKPDYIVAIGVLDDFSLNIFSAPHSVFATDIRVDSTEAHLAAIEKEIIANFSRWFRNHTEDHFVTYNGRLFDIPFITTKILQNNTEFSDNLADQLLSTDNIDLIEYAKFATGRRIGKDDACRKLANLYVPRKTEGLWNARIYKNPHLLSENDHYEMLHHNAVDLTATARLYNVVRRFPDFQEWMDEKGREDRSVPNAKIDDVSD